MHNIFIWYPKCSTCQKAKKWLDDNKIDYVLRDIVLEKPTREELKSWILESKMDIRKFFNTSGMKYRELNLKEKLPRLSDEEKIEILASDGMLIKRPIFIGNKILVGFKNYDILKKVSED